MSTELFENISKNLTSGVAKALVGLWAKDSANEESYLLVGDSIVDALKDLIPNYSQRSEVKRQIEEISERICEKVFEIIEETDKVEDSRKMHVASFAIKAFEFNLPSGRDVAKINLDPRRLSSYYLGKINFSDCDASESALVERIVSECSQYLIDISAVLPKVGEEAALQSLRNEKILLEKADAIFQEVQRIRAESASQEKVEVDFQADYLREVIRKFDSIELYGVDVSPSAKKYKLSVAYVSLHVGARISELVNSESVSSMPLDEMISKGRENEEKEIVDVEKLFALDSNFVIRGQAGSGKTTLLRWLMVKCAGRSFGEGLKHLNGFFPFFIRLREFSEKDLPKPEEFVGLSAKLISGKQPADWIFNILKEGHAMVLIDGLDELSKQRRIEVKEWIDELINCYPNNKYVVSTRPYAASEGWLDDAGFIDSELQDMRVPEIQNFINHWHSAVFDSGKGKGETKEEDVQALALHLNETVKSDVAIRKLATNPLLCAIICALHKDRMQKLPQDRVSLYEACAAMFFRRDLERSIDIGDYPNLTERQKEAIVCDLAYHLFRNDLSEIDVEHAEIRLGIVLRSFGPEYVGTEAAILKYLVERSGLLRQPTEGKIDFAHRTFQEYFAAKAIVQEGDIGFLLGKATDDLWREVVILTIALANKEGSRKIIEKLVEVSQTVPEHRSTAILLATYGLELCVIKEPQVSALVNRQLSKVLPPKV